MRGSWTQRRTIYGSYCKGTGSDRMHKAIEGSIALTKTKDAQRKVGTGRRWTKLFFWQLQDWSRARPHAGGWAWAWVQLLPAAERWDFSCLSTHQTHNHQSAVTVTTYNNHNKVRQLFLSPAVALFCNPRRPLAAARSQSACASAPSCPVSSSSSHHPTPC